MASQVLSGTGNVSYTNNTGQNVRVIINFLSNVTSMSWDDGASATGGGSGGVVTIGRNLAFQSGTSDRYSRYFNSYFGRYGYSGGLSIAANNMGVGGDAAASILDAAMPTELMLSAGKTFSVATTGSYNIVVIPEAG